MSETKATGRGRKVGRIIGRTMAIIGTTLAAVFISLYSMLWIFCHGPSKSARNLFVSTILETGALKFLAGWYFDDEEILEITSNNNMIHNDCIEVLTTEKCVTVGCLDFEDTIGGNLEN